MANEPENISLNRSDALDLAVALDDVADLLATLGYYAETVRIEQHLWALTLLLFPDLPNESD